MKTYVLLLVISMSFVPSSAQSVEFTNVLVSTVDSPWVQHVEPTMALGDDVIYIGFKNSDTHDGGGKSVSFTYSLDGGSSFQDPVEMVDFTSEVSIQSDPWMHFHEGKLYYLYLEAASYSQLTMAVTENNGETWQRVSATSANGFADKETFAIDQGDVIYVVYDDINETGSYLRLSRSYDGGLSFTDNVTIHDNALGPYVLPSTSGDIYIAYTDIRESPSNSDIYLIKSADGGNTWSDPADINAETDGAWFGVNPESGRPTIVTLPVLEEGPDGTIWVMWEDSSTDPQDIDFDVWLRSTSDGGETWGERLKVNADSSEQQWMPDFEIDSKGTLHIVYYDRDAGDSYDVKYVTYSPGSGFSDPITVTSQSTSAAFTRPGDYLTIRIDGDDVPHVVWSDGRGGEMDVYYGHLVTRSSTRGGLGLFLLPSLIALVLRKR